MPVTKRRARFGEAALQAGFITQPALEKALTVQHERDKKGESHKLLGIILLEMGAISSDQLIGILKIMNGSQADERIMGAGRRTAEKADPRLGDRNGNGTGTNRHGSNRSSRPRS